MSCDSITPCYTRLLDVMEKEPDNGNATFSLGIVYADLGRRGDAEDYYMKTLAISGYDRGTLYNLATLLTEQERLGRADGLSPTHGAIVSTLSVCACECRQSRWT